jgi:uncharacterized lipoprotein YbaY
MPDITIRGWIALPSTQRFDDAVAVVRLDDVTLVDAKSVRVAQTVIDSIKGERDRIPFTLHVDRDSLRRSSAYSLTAEVRVLRKDKLSDGDLLSTASYPWSVDQTDEAIIVVQRI